MQQMYHPDDLASMDPLVLMKNLDHVRMTSRRLSYILQQQLHLYTPEANQVRGEDDAMTRSEEELVVGTRRKVRGKARLKKYVVTEHVQRTVPVQREEVRVEYEPDDGPAADR